MVNKVDICHHCGQEKENCYYGYIAMCIPIPEFEAKKEGMISMKQDGYLKALEGLTTIEEVIRVAEE